MAGSIQNEDLKTVSELTAGGGTAAQLPNDDKIYVTANSINKTLKQAILDEDIGAPPVFIKESITLNSTQISNGYVDLSDLAVDFSIDFTFLGDTLTEGEHYSVSVAGLISRVTFLGVYALNGESELVEGDKINFKFIQG